MMQKSIKEPLLQEQSPGAFKARNSVVEPTGGSQIGFEDEAQEIEGSQEAKKPDEVKNPDVLIDFSQEMQNLKNNTEIKAPYIQTVTEDAMFLNKTQVVTLEFHRYQTSQKYIRLDSNLPENFDEHSHSHIEGDKFQTSLFPTRTSCLKGDKNNNTAFFGNDPENDENDNVKSYIPKDMRLSDPKNVNLMKVENISESQLEQRAIEQKKMSRTPRTRSRSKSKAPQSTFKNVETNFAEGVICLYQINQKGCMKKINEVSLEMNHRFFISQDGNMTLTRSTDKRVFSIVNFDNYDPNDKFFKFAAWKSNLKPWLPKTGSMEALNEGLNQYYKKVINNFDKLVSIQLVGQCNYVKFEYVEKELTNDEMDALVMKIFKFNRDSANEQGERTPGGGVANLRRKATKYVFFEVSTGEIVFQYGGVFKKAYTGQVEEINSLIYDPEKSSTEDKTIFELCLLVKEIKEEKFKSQLVFFYTGDFLNEEIKESQMIFKWSINYVLIPMVEFFSKKENGQQAMMDYVYEKIYQQIEEVQADPYNNNCFCYDQNVIEKQRLTWEQSVQVSANRTFNQFLVLNHPIKKTKNCSNTVYVNGSLYLHNEDAANKTANDAKSNSVVNARKRTFDVPLFKKLPSKPDDQIIQAGRNSFIKEELYYEIISNGQVKPICLRLDEKDSDHRVKHIKLDIINFRSQPDYMLNFNKNFKEDFQIDVFQTIHVSNRRRQSACFQTRLPTKISDKKVKNYMNIQRKSSQSNNVSTNFPIIAYNLGDQQIAFHCLLGNHVGKNYLIDLEPDERFLGFVEFNSFGDIGFYPTNLNIECCTSFLYMTTSKVKSRSPKKTNKIYLMMIDPYYKEIEVVRFMSSQFFDTTVTAQEDYIVKQVIQNSMAKKSADSLDCKTYIWAQFSSDLIRCKLRNRFSLEDAENESSDGPSEDDEAAKANDFDDDVPGKSVKELQQIEIKQDACDFLYYVVCQNNEINIMEINPRDNSYDKHLCIYRHISDKCRAFTIKNSDVFFMVDNQLNIFKLSRGNQSRFLTIEKKLALKEIQRVEFSPGPFEKLICRERYAICKAKIFYFYDVKEGPKADGLMDSEDLIDSRSLRKIDPSVHYELVMGPILIAGSSRFFCIFKITNGKDLTKYIYWVMHRLESAQKTLVNDTGGNVKFSTFLDNGNILLQCQHRFLVFTCKGSFIEEAEFENEEFFQKTPEHSLYGQEAGQQENLFNNLSIEDEDHDHCAKEEFNNSQNKKLLQLSQNNNFYVFYDGKFKKIIVYRMSCKSGKTTFEPMYELSYEDNTLFNHLLSIDIDPVQYFSSNPGQIRATNDGKVKVCYTEFMTELEKEDMKDEIYEKARKNSCFKITPRHEYDFKDKGMLYCKIYGTFFRQLESEIEGESSKDSAVRNFYDTFLFPEDAIQQMNETAQNKIDGKIRKLNRIEYTQSMIPDIYKNFNEQENLANEIKRLQQAQKKATQINAKIFFDKLVLIYGGRYVKYGHLIENSQARLPGQKNYNYFVFKEISGEKIINFRANLSKCEEVVSITETDSARSEDPLKVSHLAQITTKDYENNILKLISWNFDLNMEDSNLQMPYDPSNDGGHLIKGMNEKKNYYFSGESIIDLEYNIPILQSNIDQQLDFKTQNYMYQVKQLSVMNNQRKLYIDKTQFLGVERPNILFNSLCKLDILLWRNIQDLGSRPEDIKALCTVNTINLNFSGNSLFHMFVDDPDIIQIFSDLYMTEVANGTTTSQNENLPLQILNPNNQGFTALQLANQKQQPRSLEIMFIMTQNLPNYAITKMFIAEIPMLLLHESDTILAFFDDSFFAPLQMKLAQFVPWESDAEELVFTSHTSIMSNELLIEKMKEQGYCPQDYSPDSEKGQEQPSGDLQEQTNQDDKKQNQILPRRSLNLTEEIASQQEFMDSQLTRVEIQSIDMDWLFTDRNAKQLLELLAEASNPQVLVKAQIRIFVDLMWSQYKPNIIKYIFFPYLGFLIVLQYLSCAIIGPYHRSLEEPVSPEEHQAKYGGLMIETALTIVVATFFLSMNIVMELLQVKKNGLDYFVDVWNLIDITSLVISSIYIAIVSVNFVRGQEYFSLELIRIFGAFAAFMMWIKIFYWMRLFADLAYYVKLISQTISDSMSFSLLVLIILISFANFFYILNRNNYDGSDVQYVTEVTGFQFLDSILDVYLLGALGAFDPATYQSGLGAKFAIPMLFGATFIISIVFMNMLIAIMGETFAQVQEGAEMNGIFERVSLINDFIWLIDLNKIYKGQKYIIHVRPMTNKIDEKSSTDMKLEEIDGCLTTLIENEHFNLKQIIQKTDMIIQKNQNDVVKSQEWMMRQIKTVKNQLKDQASKEDAFENAETFEQPMNVSYLSTKTLEIIIALNRMFNDTNHLDISQEGIYDIALDWIDLVDSNGQGGIDLTEFYRSFCSIDDLVISDSDIVNIFKMFDVNGDGDISVQELAKAIKMTIDYCLKEGGQELIDKMCLQDQDESGEEVGLVIAENAVLKTVVNKQQIR